MESVTKLTNLRSWGLQAPKKKWTLARDSHPRAYSQKCEKNTDGFVHKTIRNNLTTSNDGDCDEHASCRLAWRRVSRDLWGTGPMLEEKCCLGKLSPKPVSQRFRYPRVLGCRENRVIEFHFKFIHRIVVTKKELFRFNIEWDSNWIYCGDLDSMDHTFSECQFTRSFTQEVLQWFYTDNNSEFNLNILKILIIGFWNNPYGKIMTERKN